MPRHHRLRLKFVRCFMEVVIVLVVVLFSVSVHEAAHGWAALQFGDPTAKELGRITLNPIKHLDIFFSIILPLVLYLSSGFVFGGAKPVPFNPGRMRPGTNIKKAIMWVAAAGPVSNFLMAFIFLFLAVLTHKFLGPDVSGSHLGFALTIGYSINLLLGTFNLLPIPPLDGAKVLAGLLPDRQALLLYRLERYAFLFILLILMTPISHIIRVPLSLIDLFFKSIVGLIVW